MYLLNDIWSLFEGMYLMLLFNWFDCDEDLICFVLMFYCFLELVVSLFYGEVDFFNMLIEGDNLDVLKVLLFYYVGQVKCIFIDLFYNIKSVFEQYDDNLEYVKWLLMMYLWLEFLWELFSEDGVIWIVFDDNEVYYFKVIVDEIFKCGNFVVSVIW